jgi:hypothetical protein
MLCAAALAALEAQSPVEKRPLPPPSECASEVASSSAGSTRPTAPHTSSSSVGRPVDASAHARGTAAAYKTAEKWVLAALKSLEKVPADLLIAAHEPNDKLASDVHGVLTRWFVDKTTARDAGVVDGRDFILSRKAPNEVLTKARGWMLKHINEARAGKGLRELPADWGRALANRRADSRTVNSEARGQKADSGALYHHKHDFAPSNEQLQAMTRAGFTGDQTVCAEVLDVVEASMAVALYMATGARGSELKKMHLQSLGHETIQHEQSGQEFECLKLTAFETKTKDRHLNQMLPHSDPWSDGVGLFGLSLLVRVKVHGPPPFTMQTNESSWAIVGTSTGTLDARIKSLFRLAGLRRQMGDPVTYLGRHFGTRKLQHAGGSAEGGAARTGHTSSARDHYTECPFPDMARLAGNDSTTPFVPAHHQPELLSYADDVLAHLFPQLAEEERVVGQRQTEVDRMGAKADRARTDEQLQDRERVLRALRFAARTALCCLVARPRSWKRWEIVESERTVWERSSGEGGPSRVVSLLFGGNEAAIAAMNALAAEVRRCEVAEIAARAAAPENALTAVLAAAVREVKKAITDGGGGAARAVTPELIGASGVTPPPCHSGARIKQKRESQDDVTGVSRWASIEDALCYAREELAPRERETGAKWRIIKREGGREDRARNKQWVNYKTLAIAVGALESGGQTREGAFATLQARLDASSITSLIKALASEHKTLPNADALAEGVLGLGQSF